MLDLTYAWKNTVQTNNMHFRPNLVGAMHGEKSVLQFYKIKWGRIISVPSSHINRGKYVLLGGRNEGFKNAALWHFTNLYF